MSIISPIVSNIISPIQQSITAAEARYLPDLTGDPQYGTHAPWSLTGAAGRVIVTCDDTTDAAYFWAASVGTEVVNGNQVVIENPVGPITEIFRDGVNYAVVKPQSIQYIDDNDPTNTRNHPCNEAPQYGSELVVNGNFDTDSDWTKTGGAAIAGGVGIVDGTGGNSLLYQDILEDKQTYTVYFDAVIAVVDIVKNSVIDNSGQVLHTVTDGPNAFTFNLGDPSGNFLFRAFSGSYTVDNVSVRKLTSNRLHDSNDPTQYNSYDFNGDSYMTVSPIAVDAGYRVEFDFIGIAPTSPNQYILDGVDANNRHYLYKTADKNTISFVTGDLTVSVDGVPVLKDQAIPEDGQEHTMLVTAHTDLVLATIGARYSFSEAAQFPIYNVRIYNDTGTLIHHYPMNNSKQEQTDVVGGNDGTIQGNYNADSWAVRGDNDIKLINGVERVPA